MVLLVAIGVGLTWASHGDAVIPGARFELPWWALVIGFVVVEFVAVHLESRGEAHAITFSEIPFVAGLLFSSPEAVVAGRLVAGFLVLGVVRRQSWHKLTLNLGMFAANSALAVLVFRTVLGSGSPADPGGWLAVFAALLVAQAIDTVVVTAAVTFYSGWPGTSLVRQVVVLGFVATMANGGVAIAIGSSIWDHSYLGVLIAGMAALFFPLYRSHVRLTERHKNLETLHDFTRRLDGASELPELELAVLSGACEILRGAQGALILPPVRPDLGATRVLFADGVTTTTGISPTQLAVDAALLLPDGRPRLYEPGQPLPGWLAEIGIRDAAIAPIATDVGGSSGVMVVANRLTDVTTFVDEDLQLFETLASHAGVALENGRLVARLQFEAQEQAYLALHDPVTGLPNRSALATEIERALEHARSVDRSLALLFIDLDTFKEVTDTLGGATADRLLSAVHRRLQSVLPPGTTMARYSGEQFAVLVDDVVATDDVMRLAEVVLAEFETPFSSDAVSLVLGASVGVAFYPEHAQTADLLFQRADAATYTARSEGSGIEVYAPERDPYAPRRMALAAELRTALERGEVDVYVQPKVSMVDGQVVGAEALVRWTHPRLGAIGPDQFIPAAEHTGVIRPLTHYVVRHALAQCRDWRDRGYDLGISVNLSARSLFDSHLVDDIGTAIAEAGVPASVLTLELTESTVMGDSRRSLAVLEGLSGLGVHLSVDDFGTGYSSLSHLRQLPVSELKVDKSFVMTMSSDDHDAVIVRALVDLGRSLGLTTVAEGVESSEAWDLLCSMGCEQAQGYLLSRPLPADQFVRWLERQDVRPLVRDEHVVAFPAERRIARDS